MSALVVVNNGPITEPVTVDEAKNFLRVTVSNDDLLIAALLLVARTRTADTNGPDQGKSGSTRVTAEYVQR